MIKLDCNVRKISNGYIVTENDSTGTETYYTGLTSFVSARVDDELIAISNILEDPTNDEYEFTFQLNIEIP